MRNRLHLAPVAGAAEDKDVGVVDETAHIEDGHVACLLVECCGSERLREFFGLYEVLQLGTIPSPLSLWGPMTVEARGEP